MKKHWQIKPWFFIVLLVILAGGLFYAFGYSGSGMNAGSSTEIQMMAPSFNTDEYSTNKRMSVSDNSVDAGKISERMVVKTGSLSVVVEDVAKSVEEIVNYAEEKGGFLVTSNIDKSGINLSGYLTVRVPSDLLEDTIIFIKNMGDIKNESIDGRDITEEYIDLESKLGNLKATEEQFLKIMKDAYKIEDVLAVQRELTSVRENIDVIEGRMKYLNESVDLSSITVYLSTDPSDLPVVDNEDQWKPFAVFKNALRSLVGVGKGILNGLIWFGVYLPIFVVILLIALGIKKYFSRKKK